MAPQREDPHARDQFLVLHRVQGAGPGRPILGGCRRARKGEQRARANGNKEWDRRLAGPDACPFPRTGETRTGETRTGETRTGETRTGETRTGETRTGETRTGETRTGETRTGETRTGETPVLLFANLLMAL